MVYVMYVVVRSINGSTLDQPFPPILRGAQTFVFCMASYMNLLSGYQVCRLGRPPAHNCLTISHFPVMLKVAGIGRVCLF